MARGDEHRIQIRRVASGGKALGVKSVVISWQPDDAMAKCRRHFPQAGVPGALDPDHQVSGPVTEHLNELGQSGAGTTGDDDLARIGEQASHLT